MRFLIKQVVPIMVRFHKEWTGVFFNHGFRHVFEYAEQARLLAPMEHHPLLASSRLVLFNDNPSVTIAQLEEIAQTYPFRNRTIMHPGLWKKGGRWGKHCGHLMSLNHARPLWRDADFVLFAHPDVMLHPKAVTSLYAQLQAHPRVGFFVNNFSRPGCYKTDMFLFRPRRLPDTAFHPRMCKPFTLRDTVFPECSLYQHTRELGAEIVEMRALDGTNRPLNAYGKGGDGIQLGGWQHCHMRAPHGGCF